MDAENEEEKEEKEEKETMTHDGHNADDNGHGHDDAAAAGHDGGVGQFTIWIL